MAQILENAGGDAAELDDDDLRAIDGALEDCRGGIVE